MDTNKSISKERFQSTRFMYGVMLRNSMHGFVDIDFHKMDWLLRPKHIPKQFIGNLRRNGHVSSLGRSMSSESCQNQEFCCKACIVIHM